MPSIARHQFPIIRWQNGEKHLWNPIHRKILRNRPEERVRLRVIEFLLEAGWSRYRITTEEAIKGIEKNELRTDVICYSQEFEPKILIECKAENISISKKTAEQIARYNRHVLAPYLLLSNGYQDYWYHIRQDDQSVHSLSGVPDVLEQPPDLPDREFDYWKKRGFAGEKAEPSLRRWLEQALFCFIRSENTCKYLQFNQRPADLDLNHYYNITDSGNYKIAFSLINTPYGGSRIIGIVNRKGENLAVIEVNLDLVFGDEQPNASVYSKGGIKNTDVRKELSEVFQNMDARTFETIPVKLRQLFEAVHQDA